jgi:hypothetical protein
VAPALHRPQPVPRECTDIAVACLALGEVRPRIDRWPDERWEPMLAILGRLISAYQRNDFASFLALRGTDLDFAAGEHAGRLGELRRLCGELGIPASELPDDWVGTLAAFWRGYYREPAVARFVPEAARVELHEEGLRGGSLAAWERTFESFRDRLSGRHLQHRLMIPHRRTIERVAAAALGLCWLDVDLGFEGRDAASGRLVTRFVWDAQEEEWFLHRAATVYDDGDRFDRRHLVL